MSACVPVIVIYLLLTVPFRGLVYIMWLNQNQF